MQIFAVFFLTFLMIPLIKATAQPQLYVSSGLVLRQQMLEIYDEGGYFVGSQFAQRLTYELGVELPLTPRVSLASGIQRIFFVTDVNFHFRRSEPVLMLRSNPKTGFQIPVLCRYGLVRETSNSRWRVGGQTGISFASIESASNLRMSGIFTSVSGTSIIESYAGFETQRRNFWAIHFGAYVKYRLSDRIRLVYSYTLVQSFSKRIQIGNISYQVVTNSQSTDYRARTEANGSSSNHGLSLEIALFK